jgi:predicted small integral membrane protein
MRKWREAVLVLRISKIVTVAAVALYASLVAFGNITDYGSNFAFVEHVLKMDTVFPNAGTTYRAIDNEIAHHIAYILIIAAEVATAVACWVGAARLYAVRTQSARNFNNAKGWAIAGLTFGFLVWQVGFMSIGGEWFGMWMSETWNGLQSAFRVFILIVSVLIYVALPDGELD